METIQQAKKVGGSLMDAYIVAVAQKSNAKKSRVISILLEFLRRL